MTFLPCILEKTSTFVRHLEALAKTGKEFPLVTLAINLTFDIIGAVVMDVDLEAQPLDVHSPQGELVRLYIELFQQYWDDKADMPWWLIPRTQIKRRRLGQRIDMLLKEIIRRKHAEQSTLPLGEESAAESSRPSRSILSLSL